MKVSTIHVLPNERLDLALDIAPKFNRVNVEFVRAVGEARLSRGAFDGSVNLGRSKKLYLKAKAQGGKTGEIKLTWTL